MAKLIFIVQRREGTSLEEMRKHWSGEAHLSRVRQLPGLTKFLQNHILASPAGHACDGVGELWFESDAALEQALQSPRMGAAVESAKGFLNMETTRMVIVEEQLVISAKQVGSRL